MNVRIKNAIYAGNVYTDQADLMQVAVAGRSNVGKSSLINALLGRHNLVQTSKMPGKTRNINFFQVDLVDAPSLYMVDMPGYGYAKVPQAMSRSWASLAQKYFAGNTHLKLLMLLVDIRRDILEEERMLLDLAAKANIPVLIATTKADKLSQSERSRRMRELQAASGITPVMCSAVKRWGMEQIWQVILTTLAPAKHEPVYRG